MNETTTDDIIDSTNRNNNNDSNHPISSINNIPIIIDSQQTKPPQLAKVNDETKTIISESKVNHHVSSSSQPSTLKNGEVDTTCEKVNQQQPKMSEVPEEEDAKSKKKVFDKLKSLFKF